MTELSGNRRRRVGQTLCLPPLSAGKAAAPPQAGVSAPQFRAALLIYLTDYQVACRVHSNESLGFN